MESSKIEPLVSESELASVLVVLNNEVLLKKAGSPNFVAVAETARIQEGDEIQTSDSGRAMLLYPNGSLTTLNEGTHLKIKSLKANGNSSRIALKAGSIWSRIKVLLGAGEFYEVETPGIITSVRGTEFEVTVKDNLSLITVLSNSVVVKALDPQTGLPLEEKGGVDIAAGEKVALGTQNILTGKVRRERISEEEIKTKILLHKQDEKKLIEPEMRKKIQNTQGRPAVETGTLPSTPIYTFEKISEAIGTSMIFDDNKKAQRYLRLASERLVEVENLVKEGRKGTDRVLKQYQEALKQAFEASELSKDEKIQELVARVTSEHSEILANLLEEAPEEARASIKLAKTLSQRGHRAAIEAIASKNPGRALEISIENMFENIQEAQVEAVQGNSLALYEELQNYDWFLQFAGDIQGDNAELLEVYSSKIGETLRTLEVMDTVSQNLPPGIRQIIQEVKDRSIDSQLVSLGDLAVQDPEKAINVFAREAEYYLSNMEENISQKNEEEFQRNLEAYQKYALFGEVVAQLGHVRVPQVKEKEEKVTQPEHGLERGPGKEIKEEKKEIQKEEPVRELVQKATLHHKDVLEDVKAKAPPQALEGIEKALEKVEHIHAKEPFETIESDELKNHLPIKRPRGELPPIPEVSDETSIPSPAAKPESIPKSEPTSKPVPEPVSLPKSIPAPTLTPEAESIPKSDSQSELESGSEPESISKPASDAIFIPETAPTNKP